MTARRVYVSAYWKHMDCGCGFGWYGRSDEACPWCACRAQFPESNIPRPVDIGIDSRAPHSKDQSTTEQGGTDEYLTGGGCR